ncbi:MAG TPA: SDR family NAD(P)-dependent oxidoreductase [Candidatus Eisenbacteria bacterium]|nr:SDR family NAD(P)-dependent oxidoreductase [Candidatus Eisenbacteria bacterium]
MAGAWITGGTGAIGSAVTARFLRDGLPVAVTYRAPAEWERLRSAESDAAREGRLVGIEADVTRHDSMERAARAAADAMSGIRVLAHVAGGYEGGTSVEGLSEQSLRGMLELNLVSAFWAAKHAIPYLKKSGQGRLLFISSRGAVETSPGTAPYAAAKLGIHALVSTLAKELRDFGVTANAVLPSLVDTPQNRAAMPRANHDTWVRPEQIAAVLSFLGSEASAAVTGALIPIYGRA